MKTVEEKINLIIKWLNYPDRGNVDMSINELEKLKEQLRIADVMCCSFCKEKIKFGEHEYMHREGCGCMDEPPQTIVDFERLDTGHTVTNGYPLE
jgi:hypothetical protein